MFRSLRAVAATLVLPIVAGFITAAPASAAVSSVTARLAVSQPAPTAAAGVSAGDFADGPTAGLLVRFRESASAGDILRAIAAVGGHLEESAGSTGFVVVSTGSRAPAAVAAVLAASPFVADVEPNRIRHAAAVPNDPRYSAQQAYLQAVHLPDAWEVTTGDDGLVMAIIDTGVQLTHPDLAGRLVAGWDFVNDDASPDDDMGHGTMVAGIAAASTNNGQGVAGAAWGGQIMPIKVLDSTGSGNDEQVAAGIRWAAEHGADVINLSLGGPGASTVLQEAVDYATAHDAVIVAAAGNDGTAGRHYPAACVGVVAVGATDNAGNHAAFSSYGDWVDVVAPGVGITTTKGGQTYGTGSGTSFSSPLVAAVALLLRTADLNADQATVVNRLVRSADDLGAPGTDSTYGAGMVNAAAALAISQVPDAPTIGTATPANRSATLTWTAPISDGGSPVTSYRVISSGGQIANVSGTAFAATVTGLTNGTAYTFTVDAINRVGAGAESAASNAVIPQVSTNPVHPSAPETTPPTDTVIVPAGAKSGYWMVGSDGAVYAFGNAKGLGNAPVGSAVAVDLEPTPSGNGYWIVDDLGRVYAFGDAIGRGNVDRSRLAAGEKVTSLSATSDGDGYWVFTNRGRVLTLGNAPFLGDVSHLALAGPVLDSIVTPSGDGYYMVASDGGIFAFGDAEFYGSMGGQRLNAPVQSLVPDSDGVGYWLVASDGGIFAFQADFKGSMGGTKLNKPVTGMVRAGQGYLMVGEDGGIFDFSGDPSSFKGSLGANPPARPITSVAVLETR
jgi:subtilisin family serine protease